MNAATFLVPDAGVSGEYIHILEQLSVTGGSMDHAGTFRISSACLRLWN
jgi:myosin-crossreactive antigen